MAAVVVQLLALYLPRVPVPGGDSLLGSDKAVHVLLFAAVMLTGVLAGVPARWLALALVAHAGISELVQHLLLPTRSGDVLDLVADVAGIAIGWYLATMLARHRTSAPPRDDVRR